MKFKIKYALLVLGLLGMASCSNSTNTNPSSNSNSDPASQVTAILSQPGSGGQTAAQPALSQEDSQSLGQYVADSAASDVENSGLSSGIVMGQTGSFEFPFFGLQLLSSSSCVTISNNGTTGNVDDLETFKCLGINGTIEIKDTNDATGNTFEVISNYVLTNTASDSRTVNSTASVSKTDATGVLTIGKTSDDLFSDPANKYEAKGIANEVITPTDATDPLDGGSVQLKNTVDFFKNGVSSGLFTVTSAGLEYSACGLDAGTITFANASNSCVMTFEGCGRPTVVCTAL